MRLGIKEPMCFDYIDPPPPETLMRALELLNDLAAIDDDGNLTPLGSLMAEFPVDPQLAKSLVVSPEFRCSHEMLSIVSMLSVPSIWLRSPNRRKEADAAKALLSVPEGDHLTLLNVYNNYVMNQEDKDWAWHNYLSTRSLIQASNVRNQLQAIMERNDLDLVSMADTAKLYTNIKQALVCGFFSQVAHKSGKNGGYLTVKGHQAASIFPGSSLDAEPEWVLYNEFILTTRPFLRTVTAIDCRWLLEHAPSHFDLTSFREGRSKRASQKVARKPTPKSQSHEQGQRRAKKKKTRKADM